MFLLIVNSLLPVIAKHIIVLIDIDQMFYRFGIREKNTLFVSMALKRQKVKGLIVHSVDRNNGKWMLT
jgi:hypothetical protein